MKVNGTLMNYYIHCRNAADDRILACAEDVDPL